MDENEKIATFKMSPFDDDVLNTLKDVYPDDFESIGRDILKGYTFVYKIFIEEKLIGIQINRVDVNYQHEKEFVILHTIKVKDFPGLKFADVVNSGERIIAEKFGCAWIRRHIDRPGMAPVLEKYGYQATEIVYKRKVSEWQANQPPKVLTRLARQTRITASRPTDRITSA